MAQSMAMKRPLAAGWKAMSEIWWLTLETLTAEHVEEILTWRYEPPYELYDMSSGPPNAIVLAEAIDYFLQPDYHFRAMFRQPEGQLVGFCSFGEDGQVSGGDYSAAAVDIGMGVHPAYTGRGLGAMFAGVAIDFALAHFDVPRLRVTIAEFNRRAQKVWQRHGFVPVQRFEARYGKRPFLIYTKDVS